MCILCDIQYLKVHYLKILLEQISFARLQATFSFFLNNVIYRIIGKFLSWLITTIDLFYKVYIAKLIIDYDNKK